MEMELPIVSACAFLVLVILLKMPKRTALASLPPSPPARPLIGHLHLLQLPLHLSLHKLSQKYGSIFFIMMGRSPAVVISSPFWAKEFWHTHDHQFADRPQFEASKRIFYNNRTMVMMEHGPMWRDLRKLVAVHILSTKRVDMFKTPRLEEMALCIKFLKSHARPGFVVDIRKLVFNTVGNMMTRMLFSKRSFDVSEAADDRVSQFKEMVEEAGVLFGTPVLGDLIPWLGWLDVQGVRKRMDKVAKQFDNFFEGVLVERIAARRGDSEDDTDKDYLDTLLRIHNQDESMDRDSIKCVLMDLLTAGIETTASAIEWTLAELLNNPNCMIKLQEEVDMLVEREGAALNGFDAHVTDAQLSKLRYLQATIKESLRLHPPFALNLRQMCKGLDQGAQVGGFNLPKKTRVVLNLWAMARDTTVWGTNAGIFCPERFFTDGVPDLQGHHYEFLPFGTGRRGCPGVSMALTVAPFVVANLVLMFNWGIPDGVTLDLSEAISLNAPLLNPLAATPTLRRNS